MTDTVRLIVPIAYDSWVVPRGARNARPMTFSSKVAVDIRTVAASDLFVGVSVKNHMAHSDRDYLGCEYGLFDVLKMGWGSADLPADRALAALSAGRSLSSFGSLGKPFIGLSRRFRNQEPRPFEEAALRSIERDGSADAVIAAHRLAADFLVVDDGRILLRTECPLWSSTADGKTLSPHGPLIDPFGPGEAVEFNALRLDEAKDFHRRYVGNWSGGQSGSIVVADPGLIPDRDVWRTALGLSTRALFNMSISYDVRDTDLSHLAERVTAGFEMLFGSHRDDLVEFRHKDDMADLRNEWSAPVTTKAPDPVRIAEHVDALREFAEGLKSIYAQPPRLNPGLLLRWDEYEHARAVVDDVPDLVPLAEPRP